MAFSSLRSTSSSVLNRVRFCQRSFSVKPSSSSSHRAVKNKDREKMMSDSDRETPEYDVPTSGISRPLSEILKELNKKVPDSLIKFRHEPNGFSLKYIPWHIVNRILNLHAPEWSGEVRSINYSSDGKSVSVVYRVTLYGTDAECCRLRDAAFYLEKTYLKKAQIDHVTNFKAKEKSSDSHKIYRESTGTASVDDPGYGDPVQKAEGMAFRRACARFGLGLHLYHEDMS